MNNRSNRKYFFPLFFVIVSIDFFGKSFIFFFGFPYKKLNKVFFLDTYRYIIGIGVNTCFRIAGIGFVILYQFVFVEIESVLKKISSVSPGISVTLWIKALEEVSL